MNVIGTSHIGPFVLMIFFGELYVQIFLKISRQSCYIFFWQRALLALFNVTVQLCTFHEVKQYLDLIYQSRYI